MKKQKDDKTKQIWIYLFQVISLVVLFSCVWLLTREKTYNEIDVNKVAQNLVELMPDTVVSENDMVVKERFGLEANAFNALVYYGPDSNMDAAELLQKRGISARVVKINAISPLYDRDMRAIVGKTRALLVAEECAGVGCMGQRMAAILGWNKISPERLELCNLGKAFPAQGTVEELYREFGLDAESLAKKAAEVLQ